VRTAWHGKKLHVLRLLLSALLADHLCGTIHELGTPGCSSLFLVVCMCVCVCMCVRVCMCVCCICMYVHELGGSRVCNTLFCRLVCVLVWGGRGEQGSGSHSSAEMEKVLPPPSHALLLSLPQSLAESYTASHVQKLNIPFLAPPPFPPEKC